MIARFVSRKDRPLNRNRLAHLSSHHEILNGEDAEGLLQRCKLGTDTA